MMFNLRFGSLVFLAFLPTSLLKAGWDETPWDRSDDTATIAYFLYSGETSSQLLRFGRLHDQWMEPLMFEGRVKDFAVSEAALFIAYEYRIAKFGLDGRDEVHLFDSQEALIYLGLADPFLIVFTADKILSLDRDEGHLLYSVSQGGSGHPDFLGRDFYFTTGYSPPSLIHYRVDDTGQPKRIRSSQYDADVPLGRGAFPKPDKTQFVTKYGIVLDHDEMVYENSLGGPLTDLAFFDGGLVIIRDDVLFAFDNQSLEIGRFSLPQGGLKVLADGTRFTVFLGSGSQLTFLSIDLDAFELEQGTPADATDLDYYPGPMVMDRDEILYIVSNEARTIFLWSAAEQGYVGGIGLPSSPDVRSLAYRAMDHRLFVGFSEGAIHSIDLNAGFQLQPFVNRPGPVSSLITTRDFVVSTSGNGSSGPIWCYDREGQVRDRRDAHWGPQRVVWNPFLERLYYTSQAGLAFQAIGENGEIGNAVYRGIRDVMWGAVAFSSDNRRLLAGNGGIYDAEDFQFLYSLSENAQDGGWFGDRLFSLTSQGEVSWLDEWAPDATRVHRQQLPGFAQRLFFLNQGLVAVSFSHERPQFYVQNWECSLDWIPTLAALPEELALCPGEKARLSLDVLYGQFSGLQWRKDGMPLDGEIGPHLSLTMTPDRVGSYDCVLSHCSGSVVSDSVDVHYGMGHWTEQTPGDWPGVPQDPCNDLNQSGGLDLLDLVLLINQREL